MAVHPLRSVYDQIGGEPALARILAHFYKNMSTDVMIGYFFHKKDVVAIAEKQKLFLMKALGVSKDYSGKNPSTAHLELPPILPGHFDRRLKILEETLTAEGLTAEDIRTWVDFEDSFRSVVVS